MKTPVFTGVSTAIITPFLNGKIDYDSYRELLNMQKIAGIPAVTVCGTTGEAVTMTPDEQYELIKYSVANKEQLKIIAGCGTNDTMRASELAQAAESAGADALLIVTPYYNKPSQKGLIEHYTYIADRVSKPIILYNVPSRTGVSLSPDTCRILSQHKNINGIKEASGDLNLTSEIINACGDSLNIWSGNDDNVVPMMSLGACGVISVASNIIPREMVLLTRYCRENNFKDAAALQLKYQKFIKTLFCLSNPIPIKTMMAVREMCAEEFRLPLCLADENNKNKILSVMYEYDLI